MNRLIKIPNEDLQAWKDAIEDALSKQIDLETDSGEHGHGNPGPIVPPPPPPVTP